VVRLDNEGLRRRPNALFEILILKNSN